MKDKSIDDLIESPELFRKSKFYRERQVIEVTELKTFLAKKIDEFEKELFGIYFPMVSACYVVDKIIVDDLHIAILKFKKELLGDGK